MGFITDGVENCGNASVFTGFHFWGLQRDVKFKGRICLNTDFGDVRVETSLMGVSTDKNGVAGMNMLVDGELKCQGWVAVRTQCLTLGRQSDSC